MLALDLVIYLQHVMFHAVPLLWRLHRVHHADLGFDVTTGTRFHPLEILLSMGLKGFVIAALGPPPVAVLVFEVLLNATSMFNHGNVRIPERIDRVLRRVVVTPDMHRVHHSIEVDEANSNFGFNLPWWDRLFGTYREAPRAPHEDLTIGIRGLREPAEVARSLQCYAYRSSGSRAITSSIVAGMCEAHAPCDGPSAPHSFHAVPACCSQADATGPRPSLTPSPLDHSSAPPWAPRQFLAFHTTP